MNISEPFIRRPVMTVLVMAGILIFGIISYRLLPVNALPNVDFPTIQVQAQLPGASPETMASAVATPLEKQFSTIAGIDSMTSVSTDGLSTVTLQFSLDRSIDAAAQDVQSAIAAAARSLPSTMPTPPTQRKVNPADAPIMNIVLSSTTLPLSTVAEYAENLLAQQISTISGVAQVGVYGSQQYAVRIQLDPNAMATRGIAITDVEQAVGNSNVNLPTGTLYGNDRATSVQATGQLTNAAAYAPMIVAYRNGAPVRLSEIGRVTNSVQNNKIAAWFNGTRGIMLGVQRQPGTNTIEIVDAIRKILPTFETQLPPAISLNVFYDRSVPIRASVHDVQQSLLLALVLVVSVIFVFLRRVSATVIPSLALPMSIVGTFALMYALSYSLDNLSLMALTLCVGFVVDDAIVMLENITRHMEMGKSRWQATLDGSKEIAFTIVSMTISLAAVFIPVLFMGGILGRLLREFAVTIIGAVLISGFVSLTLTPMLCSRMLSSEHDRKHGRVYALSERMFDAMLSTYRSTLSWVMRHQRLTIAVFFAITIGTGFLFAWMPKGFLPADDSGLILVFTEAAQDVSFDAMSNDAKAGCRHRQGESAHRRRDVDGGRRRTERVAQRRTHLRGAHAARRRGRAPTRSCRSCVDRCRAFRASGPMCRTFPRSASAARSRRAPTSTRCRARTRRSSTTGRRRSRTGCARCRASSTSRATCRSRSRWSWCRSTATRRRRWAFRRRRSKARSTTRTDPARCRRSSRRRTSTGS